MLSFMPSDLAFVFQSIMCMDTHICKQHTHGRIAKSFCLFAKDVCRRGRASSLPSLHSKAQHRLHDAPCM